VTAAGFNSSLDSLIVIGGFVGAALAAARRLGNSNPDSAFSAESLHFTDDLHLLMKMKRHQPHDPVTLTIQINDFFFDFYHIRYIDKDGRSRPSRFEKTTGVAILLLRSFLSLLSLTINGQGQALPLQRLSHVCPCCLLR
jgi:hypothetical protein